MKKIWPPIILLLGYLLLHSPPIFADIIYYDDQSDVEEAPDMDDQETMGPQEWTENEENASTENPLAVNNIYGKTNPEGCGSRERTPRPRLMGVKTFKEKSSDESEEEAGMLK